VNWLDELSALINNYNETEFARIRNEINKLRTRMLESCNM